MALQAFLRSCCIETSVCPLASIFENCTSASHPQTSSLLHCQIHLRTRPPFQHFEKQNKNEIITAVVGSAEQRDELSFREELVAVFDDLVGATYQIEVVFVQELADDLRAEREADAPVVLAPAHLVLVGVGPEQIAEQTLVGHVGRSHYPTDLLHRLEVGAEAPVTAEDLLIDDGGHRQTVETVGERFP